MSLSTLTLHSMEHYGGVDLKKNYRKYFSGGLGISIGLHLLLLAAYLLYSWLTYEPKIVREFIPDNIFGPPPTIIKDTRLPENLVKQVSPKVTDAIYTPTKQPINVTVDPIKIDQVMPFDPSVTSVLRGVPGASAVPLSTEIPSAPPAANVIPPKGEWNDVTEEPRPVLSIQDLVVYPANAIRSQIEGTVTVSALIDEAGRVLTAEVEKSDHPWLEQAAIDAMLKARFTPAKNGDEPVKFWYTQTVRFKLNN